MQVSHCFEMAISYAVRVRARSYSWYVRLRPDFAILQHAPLPLPTRWERLSGRSNLRVYFGPTKPDFAFALTHAGLQHFLEVGRARLLPCPARGVDPNALEWAHPGFFGSPSWAIAGGLVRSEHFIDQFGQDMGPRRTLRGNRFSEGTLRPLTVAESRQQRCDVAGRPEKEPPATCPKQLTHLLGPEARATRLQFVEEDVHWSERYSSFVSCGGHGYLFARRADGDSHGDDLYRWRTTVRRQWGRFQWGPEEDAGIAQLSHNAHVVCAEDGHTLMALGGRFRPSTGEPGVRALEAESGWPLRWAASSVPTLRGDHAGCLERRETIRVNGRDVESRGACEFDGRLSAVRHAGALLVYARANLHAKGGARHVQRVTIRRVGRGLFRSVRRAEWSRFEPLHFAGYNISQENNIYSFIAHRYRGALLGAFPAVIDGVGGIFCAVSADGVFWSRPMRLMSSRSAKGRTADHPVRWSFETSGTVGLHVEHDLSTVPSKGSHGPYHCIYEFPIWRLEAYIRKSWPSSHRWTDA